MTRGARFFLVLLAGIFVTATPAGAQSYLEKRRDGINREQQKQQPPKAFGNKGLVPPSFGKWNQDPNKATCPSGEGCADPDYNRELIDPSQTKRLGSVNNYGSMIGFQAGMNSKFHVDATVGESGYPGYLNGELTLAYITMGLTEPAVAAGLSQALNYVGHDIGNRLQSEQVFFQQLAYMPDISESVGQAYISCISTKTSQGENWMTAQAACSGDTAKDLQGNKAKFEDISEGKSLLSYKLDPNHPDYDPASPPQAGEASEILLSQYLFERDAKNSQGAQMFKDSFVQFIGDIKYTMKASNSTNLGTRSLEYSKVLPTRNFADELKEEAANKVLRSMLDTFEAACAFSAPDDPQTAEEGDAIISQLTQGDNWADKLSFPGFAPDSNLMRMLWELTADPSTNICPNGGNYDEYEWDAVVSAGNAAPEVAREYIYIAQRIAFGRLYSLFILAEDYLRRFNIGPFDSFARRGAFEILYDAAGTHDMQAMFNQNADSLREYLTLLAERTARNKANNKAKGIGPAGGQEQQISSGITNPSNN